MSTSGPRPQILVVDDERVIAQLIADVLRDGMREGTIREMDPERAAYVLFMGGFTLSHADNQRYYPYGEVLPVFTEINMNGLVRR